MYGWAGRILRVDLSTGTCTIEPLREEWAREFVGGRGLAARYLFEELDPTVDAFDPANVLIFVTGPLTGTNTSCGSRYMVVTKSPLTGAITYSNSGGHFGPAMKHAGYDLILIKGRAERPVYLAIYDDDVQLRSAESVWGCGVFETEDRIRDELVDPDVRIACIGPAGENRVRFAAVMNDKHRAAGRSGVGAVMGAKNLKAIAIRGTRGLAVADPAAFLEAVWQQHRRLSESEDRKGMTELGTAAVIDLINEFGGLPTRNFQEGVFEGAEKLNGAAIKEQRLVRNKACFACTIACGRVTHLPGEAAGKFLVNTHPRNWKICGEGPEYENLWGLGVDCGIDDLDAVIKANWLCNDLGMDPISMGSTLAAAMELYERGVINDEITGMPLKFGSSEALIRMVEATGYREGFGNELAEGSRRLAEKFGQPDVHIGSKGQEFPAYDPRGFVGMGLAYATCTRGACHLRAWTPALETANPDIQHKTEGKAPWVVSEQNKSTAHDNTGVCLFTGFAGSPPEDLVAMTAAATGLDYSMDAHVKVGERTWNLEHLFNLRAGHGRHTDTLPERITRVPLPSGRSKGVTVNLEPMLEEYYKIRGWTSEGIPTREKLAELGLENLGA